LITFIIGNGFDIEAGLRTRYSDFYEEYKIIKPDDNAVIAKFKKDIDNDYKTWADYELAIGKYSGEFSGESGDNSYLDCHIDFTREFDEYLKRQCDGIDFNSTEFNTVANIFYSSLLNFWNYFNTVNRKYMKGFVGDYNTVCFLQFNYTNLLDTILKKSANYINNSQSNIIMDIGKNIHIHGKMQDKKFPIIMGVNSVEQIKNTHMRKNEDIKELLVKPNTIHMQQEQDPNRESERKIAEEAIEASRIICVFGASIGETDEYWWGRVGEWLKNSMITVLVIFNIFGVEQAGTDNREYQKNRNAINAKRKAIKEQFLNLSGLGIDWIEDAANENRILVELDTQMFKFGKILSKKEN